ncbi:MULTISPECIES: hypothetical protein [Microbispora]|uniref:Uncharacterized protein n=1 Tax=Microbispora catharanthi TaxID=1712871 RepID=A0A5N6BXZ1_9ACTN|nr:MULTISPECIES: hypothetical protein [Microbispora]KAB8185352.1 hypothetical protein FH610_011160 [Microbispora catharanthi]GLX07153.1 hypothetical protein Misp03_40790 [Microbispora sp. NBRC 16548]
MSSSAEQTFVTRGGQAAPIADETSVRDLWSRLSVSLERDHALRARFATDPMAVLSEQGLSRDLQEETTDDTDGSKTRSGYGCTYRRCPD